MAKVDKEYDKNHCANCSDNCGTCTDAFKHVGNLSEVKGTPFFDQENFHIVRYRRK
jgi:hypothetical protein